MRLLRILVSLLLINTTYGQMPGGFGGTSSKIYDGKIQGVVIDGQSKKPVEFANVALYKTNDSIKPLDGTITDEKGAFKIKDIKPGKYKVVVSFIAYSTYRSDTLIITDKKPAIDLGNIIFNASAKTLKQANVVEEAPLIESQIDKIVYNASKDLTVKGGNAGDVLRNVPMVTVDLNGNVELRGTQNVRVLINNKPSNIMAASVADAMKMIPADEVEKVEVITSPSAKYDAEGTGGIINIITKRKNLQGLNGSVNAGIGTRSSNLFGNLNYRQGRFGIGSSIGGFGFFGNGNLNALRTNYLNGFTNYLKQTGDNSILGMGPFVQLNSDYDFNSKNTINASIRVSGMFNHTQGFTDNTFSTDNETFVPVFTNTSDVKTNRLGYDANLDYKKTFAKSGQEFSVSAQLTNNNSNTDYDTERDTLEYIFYREESFNKSRNREATLQADYVHPITKKTTIEAGAKTIIRDVKSDYHYTTFNFATQQFEADSLRNNIFNYDQDIYAAYLQGATSVGKFGFKAGVRYETTNIAGAFLRTSEEPPFKTDYNNWVPSATVSYTESGKWSTKIAYSKRIQRPSITFLNPFVNQSDPTNISYGNPALEAEASHSFELGYNLFRKFGSINTSAYHRFTDNAIESFRFLDSNQIYNTTYGNLGKNSTTGLSVSANIIHNKTLIIGGNFNAFYYTVESKVTGLSNEGLNYSAGIFSTYKFNPKWAVQLFGNFNGPKYSLQGKATSFFFYSASVRREFKNEKGGIGLGLDNFLSPYLSFKNTYSGNDFNFNSTNKFFFLGVRVNFEYRFGKVEFNNGKRKKIKNDDLKQGEEGGMGGMGNGR
jgi:ferric enterobactin receptor